MFKKLRNILGISATAIVVTTTVNIDDDASKILASKKEDKFRAQLQQNYKIHTVSGSMKKCEETKDVEFKKSNKIKKAPKPCIKL